MTTLKVVVTGGAGQIAYSLVPLIARGLVFGPGVRVHLRLLDIPPAANALEGVAMEVQDSLFSTVLDGVLATTDEGKAFDGAQRMGEALERYACHNCKVVVVANPAPTNCLVLSSHAPSLPRRNISCLSRLDHDRMVGMLLHEANRRLSAPVSAGTGDAGARGWRRLGPADVRGACVWGNHSNSQVPDASAVDFLIDGSWVPAVSVIGDSGWLDLSTSTPLGGRVLEGEVSGLAEAVRGRGAAVLGARKLSSAMSAANAIAGHLSDWLAPAAVSVLPSPAVSMGVTSDGNPFGVPEGLFCSFPVHCGGDGEWAFAEGYRLSEEAERQLEASIAELREEKSIVSEMLGEGAAAEGSPTSSFIASSVGPGHSSAAPVSSL